MNKKELIEAVHEILGGTKADAERAVEAFIDTVVKSLKKGKQVSIAGFGIFEVKKRKARTGRNPLTGETIKIPAKKVPSFRAAKALKDAVN